MKLPFPRFSPLTCQGFIVIEILLLSGCSADTYCYSSISYYKSDSHTDRNYLMSQILIYNKKILLIPKPNSDSNNNLSDVEGLTCSCDSMAGRTGTVCDAELDHKVGAWCTLTQLVVGAVTRMLD